MKTYACGFLVCILALSSSIAFGESFESKQKITRLKKENWALKHFILHSSASIRGQYYNPRGHGADLGIDVAPLGKESAALLGLGSGEGIEILGVTSREAAKVLKPGDVILGVQADRGPPRPAMKSTLLPAFLPGDTVHLEIVRDLEKFKVTLLVKCTCCRGRSCPFFSPYGPEIANPDDPIERNRKLIEEKFKDIKKLDATCGTGRLMSPNVPAYMDDARKTRAADFNHEEWVKVLEQKGDMFRVQSRRNKEIAWVEAKYVRDIFMKIGSNPSKVQDDFDHVIHQLSTRYPNDKVLLWATPARKKRKLILPPGTLVKVLKTVDGATYGSPQDIYLIKTKDGREGWVPAGWIRKKK
jgi:hypothetical protein